MAGAIENEKSTINASIMSKLKLRWHEPRWCYVPKLWRQLRQIVNARSLASITATSVVVGITLVIAFRIAIPFFVVPATLWWMLLALPAIILHSALHLTLLTLIPPTIKLQNGSLRRIHSSSGPKIGPEHVRAAWLTVHAGNRIRLKLRYCLSTRERTRVYGIPNDIDLDLLVRLLPCEPKIRDARKRSLCVQASE